jgi:hypothetical protein
MTPAVILADSLAAARREGASFTDVWPVALADALQVTREPAEWRDVLDGMAATWRAAFEREGATVPAPLYVLGEGRGEAVPERPCGGCGQEIPPGKAPGAIYCSRACNWQVWKQRQQAGSVAA